MFPFPLILNKLSQCEKNTFFMEIHGFVSKALLSQFYYMIQKFHSLIIGRNS